MVLALRSCTSQQPILGHVIFLVPIASSILIARNSDWFIMLFVPGVIVHSNNSKKALNMLYRGNAGSPKKFIIQNQVAGSASL